MIVKIFINIMSDQNILKFYGSKLDIALDYSQYYDYELTFVDDNYDLSVIDFNSEIVRDSLLYNVTSFPDTKITCPDITDTENCYRRPNAGWTLDMVFNRNGLPWSSGKIFYYTGVIGSDEPNEYADNNLSFGFTDTRRIKWQAIRYSGVCEPDSGYTESFYVTSGVTRQFCNLESDADFNITIVFKRYSSYYDCFLPNEGGWNDLITGATLINNPVNIMSGETPVYEYNEILNKNWLDENYKRMGELRFYINGFLISRIENWEEVVLSDRGENPFRMIFGDGTDLMNNIHFGTTLFEIKEAKFYTEPLDFSSIYHDYKYRSSFYNFYSCEPDCTNDVTGII